jgi:hypothetical protein
LLGALAALVTLWLAASPTAHAAKPRCRLERLDASRLDEDGRVKVVGGVVELEGQVNRDRPAASYRLQVNGKTVAKAEKLEDFEKTGQELYVVLAVEVSALYAPVIEQIKEAVREFLGALPPRTKVKLISFGYELQQLPAFLAPPALMQSIDDLTPDEEGDVQLLNAVSAGLTALNRLSAAKDKEKDKKPAQAQPPRKVLVVLSDGLNQLMDRKNFKRVGDLLRQNGVPLFPIGFSPRDDRGPLLNLGELAKRSHGTFRWAQKPENLKEQFLNLAEELRQSAVLTFPGKKLDAKELGKATVTLQCGDIRSNAAAAPLLPAEEKSRWWRWLLGIVLALVGLWGAAQLALFLLRRRAARLGVPASQPPLTSGALPTGGYPAAASPPGTNLAVGALPQRPGRLYTATLIGIGPLVGTRVKVESNLFVGKAVQGPNALQVSTDPSLAPTHGELRRDAQGFVLIDLGAQSGCFVNDQRVSGQARVQDGDVIRFGTGTQLKFRIDD